MSALRRRFAGLDLGAHRPRRRGRVIVALELELRSRDRRRRAPARDRRRRRAVRRADRGPPAMACRRADRLRGRRAIQAPLGGHLERRQRRSCCRRSCSPTAPARGSTLRAPPGTALGRRGPVRRPRALDAGAALGRRIAGARVLRRLLLCRAVVRRPGRARARPARRRVPRAGRPDRRRERASASGRRSPRSARGSAASCRTSSPTASARWSSRRAARGDCCAREPERARDSILTVEHTGREALADLRRLLGMLRKDDDPRALAPQPGLDQLGALMESIAPTVSLRPAHEGEPVELTPGIDLVGYRVIEAVLRAAAAASQRACGRHRPLPPASGSSSRSAATARSPTSTRAATASPSAWRSTTAASHGARATATGSRSRPGCRSEQRSPHEHRHPDRRRPGARPRRLPDDPRDRARPARRRRGQGRRRGGRGRRAAPGPTSC